MSEQEESKNRCPNCNFEFSDSYNYCPSCGQENLGKKIHMKHFLVDFMGGMFNFDTKVLITFRDIFIPGRIINNYNLGKRARYVTPVKLFLFVSFLFFLLLSLTSKSDRDNEPLVSTDGDEKSQIVFETSTSKNDTTASYMLEEIKNSPHPDKLIDKYIIIKYKNINWFNRNLYRNVVKLETGHIDQETLKNKIFSNFSYSMFLLMPLFALYLKLLYRRKKMHYSEHVIFSMYFHSLVFILLILDIILGLMHLNSEFVVFLVITAYMLLLLRKVYSQSWAKTFLKFLILSFTYSLSIFIVLLIGIALSVIV